MDRMDRMDRSELAQLRESIDGIDAELTALFVRRMDLCARIARCKAAAGLPLRDLRREREKLDRVCKDSPEALREYTAELYGLLLELSRRYQAELIQDWEAEP